MNINKKYYSITFKFSLLIGLLFITFLVFMYQVQSYRKNQETITKTRNIITKSILHETTKELNDIKNELNLIIPDALIQIDNIQKLSIKNNQQPNQKLTNIYQIITYLNTLESNISSDFVRNVYLISIASILLLIVFYIIFNLSFEKEIFVLTRSVNKIVENNFSRKIKFDYIKSNNEIGNLSYNISLLIDKMHQRKNELVIRRKEVEDANKNTLLLSEIGRNIITHLDIKKIIRATFENVTKLVDASLLAVGLYDNKKRGLDFYGIRKGSEVVYTGFDDLTNECHWSTHCFKSQQEILCGHYDVCSGKYFSNLLFNEPLEVRESFIYLPLTSGQNQIGVITVQSFQPQAYSGYHLGILKNLANYITIAFLNAEAYKQIEEQNKQILETSELLRKAHNFLEEEVQLRTREIMFQKEEIEKKNLALERLSLVATKTDNAIMIMDAQGNIEWINDCFTRIYNYSYNDFITKRGRNILQTSFNPEIKETLDKCIRTKKAVYYEALNITSDGKEVWTQTTLTPVLNNNNEITHLLTIDSDITKRKETELFILKQSQDITNSIHYAKRIQNALLAPSEWFREIFGKNHFIFYRPKDIVSGDFYWLHQQQNKVYIAVADCTGHGVPGAFMSILGISLLNQIVTTKDYANANDILNQLRIKLKQSLRQTGKTLETFDGMDITLCIINKQEAAIQFSGAYNSLYRIRNHIIEEFKGNKMPIGIYINDDEPFTNINLTLHPEDKFYLSTDGIFDQFGGERNSKFMSKRFKETILKSKNLSFAEQKRSLEQTLLQWQGINNEQIDDICVIGFSV